MGREMMRPLFDVVHPAFSLAITASPALQCALEDSFAELVVARDIPEPCAFLSRDSRQKRFLWIHSSSTRAEDRDGHDYQGEEQVVD